MKIRNSSRITAIVLALMMIVPLISIPAMAEDTAATPETVIPGAPVWSEDFDSTTLANAMASNPVLGSLKYGVGGKDSTSYYVDVKAGGSSELYTWVDRNNKWPVTEVVYADGRAWTGLDQYDGSEVIVKSNGWTGIQGVITTVDQNTNTFKAATNVGNSGKTSICIVEAGCADVVGGGYSFAKESYIKNSKVDVTDNKVIVLEANYFFSEEFSTQFESRVYLNNGSKDASVDLVYFVPSGNQVKVMKHNDCIDKGNAGTGVLINKGEWVNLKFVIEVTGVPTTHCFINDVYAFSVDESNAAEWNQGQTAGYVAASKWNLGHASRGVAGTALQVNSVDSAVAVDDVAIYTSTEGMKLSVWNYELEALQSLAFTRIGTTLDSTTFADSSDHGTVIKTDSNIKDNGKIYLRTANHTYTEIKGATIANGKASGTVTVSGTTYTFTEQTINTDNCKTAATLVDPDGKTNTSYYIVNGAVKASLTIDQNIANVGAEANIFPNVGKSLVSKLTFSADYYFDKGFAMNGMDIRLNITKLDFFGLAKTNTGDANINVTKHGNLAGTGTANTVAIAKGMWHTFTVTIDTTVESGTRIKGYVDGMLVFDYLTTVEVTEITRWNLGHVTRNGSVSQNKGNWYIDNIAIYYGDAAPIAKAADSTMIFEEDFERTTNVSYAGTEYGYADYNGDNFFKIDTDTLKDDNDTSEASRVVGNLDQNLYTLNPQLSYSTYKNIVLETDYYLEPNSRQQIEAQIRYAKAKYSTTFGTDGATEGRAGYVQLYTLVQKNGEAYIANFGSSNSTAVKQTTTYNNRIPTGRWFTLSLAINLETGATSFYLDGVLIATTYLYATSGVTGWLTDITVEAGGTGNGFILAKMNSLKSGSTQVGYTSSWPQGYSGYCGVDNIKIYSATAPKNASNSFSADFSNAILANGKLAQSAGTSSSATHAPSKGIYTNEIGGNMAVKFDMTGATAATKTANPFLAGFNSRAYDLKVKSAAGTWTPKATGKVTADDLQYLTMIGSITDPSKDKPVYYYWEGGNVVHVYNNNGNAVDANSTNKLSYTKYTLSDLNYRADIRAMCGGTDANIDKNYYLNTPEFSADGTYMMSVDYYIPASAGGKIQSQFYSDWTDIYCFDLDNEKFCAANAVANVEADIIVDAWNTVTMVATIKAGSKVALDVYFNGVYCFSTTAKADGHNTIKKNDWIVFKATKPSTANVASTYTGNIYVDNIQINAVAYDANDFVTLKNDAIEVTTLGRTSLVNDKGAKIYAPNGYSVFSASDYNGMIKTEAAASIRLKANLTESGLRFGTKVDVALLDELYAMVEEGKIKAVSFGTLIAPLDAANGAEGAELKHTDAFPVLDVVADYGYYFNVDESEKTTHFVGSIINLYYEDENNHNYARDFSGRGYVAITLNNGTVYYVYSDYTHTVSIAEQAQKTIDSGKVTNAKHLEILDTYAALNK